MSPPIYLPPLPPVCAGCQRPVDECPCFDCGCPACITASEGQPEDLDLQDTLDDLLLGVEMWKDRKVSNATWDNEDEMLARWIEAKSGS